MSANTSFCLGRFPLGRQPSRRLRELAGPSDLRIPTALPPFSLRVPFHSSRRIPRADQSLVGQSCLANLCQRSGGYCAHPWRAVACRWHSLKTLRTSGRLSRTYGRGRHAENRIPDAFGSRGKFYAWLLNTKPFCLLAERGQRDSISGNKIREKLGKYRRKNHLSEISQSARTIDSSSGAIRCNLRKCLVTKLSTAKPEIGSTSAHISSGRK